MVLFPAAGLDAAAGEQVGLAALHVLGLLHIVGVARVGRNVGKADHHIVEGQLLAGQLVHRGLELFGAVAVHRHLIVFVPTVVGEARFIAG